MAATDVSRVTTSATQATSSGGRGTASPTTASDPDSNGQRTTDSGISGGAVAGAVIGTAVGVALLTIALTFWLARRGVRKRGLQRQRRRSSDGLVKRSGTGTSGGRRRSGWQEHLPQSLDDQTVRRRVKAVLDQAAVHVENNFSEAEAEAESQMEAERERERQREDALSAFESPHLPAPLAALIGQTRRPTLLIKHALAYSLLVASDRVLLPPTLTELPRVVEQRPDRPRSASQALSHWRRLTAYLYPAPSADPAFQAHRNASIQRQVDLFARAFSPWLAANPSPDRRANLVAIFEATADVSYMLFSQPSALEYDWAARPDGSSVILPGLLKVTDEYGTPLPYAHVLLQPSLVRSL